MALGLVTAFLFVALAVLDGVADAVAVRTYDQRSRLDNVSSLIVRK
jgi:hypothetical protein